MEILKKISKAFLRIALYLVVIAAVFYLTATLVFKDLEKKNTKLVTDAIPEMFPLLIVYPPTNSQPLSIKPIYYKNFNETLIQNRNYTFNIPEGKEAEINKLLKEQSRAFMKPRDFNWESENPWEAHIIVEKSENGKQSIRFFETWDDDRENVGWYEANNKQGEHFRYCVCNQLGIFLRIALYLVVIAAVFYLTATLVFKDLEKKNTKLVTDAIPEMFPLLIVYPPTN